ncbi:molybdate ABC transporter permease subunit [Cytobacillus spongiae]|uniref:molybdate ABC transporter permease subunit n=1 Tax=Cytobacillus spongiae TaxID=2901381 RepID=UPI001F34F8D3|nr:molybdate ABC transporter permease subunit [Cytobacillus spongiae]UII54284.1 molybdate ABC transporter permease subunit [Cytobacillus spongiae]
MSHDFWSPIRLSIEIASISVFIVILFGTLIARWMAIKNFKGKLLLENLLLLPLVLPPTVVGFLLIVLFGKNGVIGKWIDLLFHQSIMFTMAAAVIASTVVAFPLMYQSAKTGFLSVDRGIEEAARMDGASEWKLFVYISLPLAGKALIAGGILSFARALGEFGATLMFAGNLPGKTQTIPTAIYVALESGEMNLAWLWAISMVGISFLMLLLTSRIK